MTWISAEKFDPGAVKVSQELRDLMELDAEAGRFVEDCLSRHCRGDWGATSKAQAEANERAIELESQGKATEAIRSRYSYPPRPAVEIVTDKDRRHTTISLERRDGPWSCA